MGLVLLVGSDPVRFEAEAERLWLDAAAYAQMATPRFPYGDGNSAGRIAEVLKGRFSQVTSGEKGIFITSVTLDGKPYVKFNASTRLLTIPSGIGGEFRVTYTIRLAGRPVK